MPPPVSTADLCFFVASCAWKWHVCALDGVLNSRGLSPLSSQGWQCK